MKNKKSGMSKTIDKKNSERIKEKLIERELKTYFKELKKDPTEWFLSFLEAWEKNVDRIPFDLHDLIRNKPKFLQLSQNEKEKFLEPIVDFVIKIFKLEEIERKIEREVLKPPPELPKKKEKDLPPTKFGEVKKLPYIPINPDFYDIVPYVIPYRITENSLVHKEILKDNSLALKYKIESRGKTIIFSFMIPAEVLGKIEEKDIPTVGVNMRRSLYSALAFAFVQNTASPNFRRSQLLEFIGEDTQKTRKLYSDLDKGLLTWAYGTYTIISGDKVSEVGHIVNKVKLAKKRGDRTLVEFNPEVVKPLFRSQMDTETLRYIAYPTDLLKVRPKEMKLYVRNFCESLLKKQGMGRNVYPKYVKNILVQDFGTPLKKLKKLSHKQIDSMLMEGFKAAEAKGLLETHIITHESAKKAGYHILNWKIKLILPSKPEDDL